MRICNHVDPAATAVKVKASQLLFSSMSFGFWTSFERLLEVEYLTQYLRC